MPAEGYAEKFRSARESLFDLLSDLGWHAYSEFENSGNRHTARIRELRRLGYVIVTRDLEVGREYRLTSVIPDQPIPKRVRIYMDEDDAVSVKLGLPSRDARRAADAALASFEANRGKL